MYRTTIFCSYNVLEKIGKEERKLIAALQRLSDTIIIVINGNCTNQHVLKKTKSIIVRRENTGFDAGAYKEVLCSDEYKSIIEKSDELVLCNNSFYGPFVDLQSIFDIMEEKEADFWGLSEVNNNISRHIQSYFLVFKKRTIDTVKEYFRCRINEETTDFNEICISFENGLFRELLMKGFKHDAYVKSITCEPYRNALGSIVIDKLPILKRKVFTDEYYNKMIVTNVLNQITKLYSYDIHDILEEVNATYGYDIESRMDAPTEIINVESDLVPQDNQLNWMDIHKFLLENPSVYIYGIGGYSRAIFNFFFFYHGNPAIRGFIVSDDQYIKETEYYGRPVFRLSEVKDKGDSDLLVALTREHTVEVRDAVSDFRNILFLWKDTN